MKKFTFVILSLIFSATAFGQTDVTASAKVVSAIDLSLVSNLDFGTFSTGTAGTVIADPVTGAGGTLTTINGTTPVAAVLTINAEDGYGYALNYSDISISNGTDSMLINLTDNSSGTGNGSDETFKLGGTLNVAGTESAGDYSGIITVTVSYN